MAETEAARRGGCARHLPILGMLFLVAAALLVGRHWQAFGQTFRNMSAMEEGRAEAERLADPDSLVAFLARHPGRASLVVLDLDAPERSLRYQADAARPVVGLPALVALAAYAEALADGEAAPDDTVARAALADRFLPVRRHAEAFTEGPPRVRLDALARLAATGSDEAADVLAERLGAERLARTAGRFGLEPPLPATGLYLLWADSTLGAPSHRAEALAARPRAERRRAAEALAHRFLHDDAFRLRARERFRTEGLRLTLPEQRALAAHALPEGTAAGYAALLAEALAGPHPIAEALGRPVGEGGAVLGSMSRAFPGHVALAAFVQAPGGRGTVAVLLLEDLPMAVFYHLTQTGMEAGLVLRLLMDTAYRHSVTAQLNRLESNEIVAFSVR